MFGRFQYVRPAKFYVLIDRFTHINPGGVIRQPLNSALRRFVKRVFDLGIGVSMFCCDVRVGM